MRGNIYFFLGSITALYGFIAGVISNNSYVILSCFCLGIINYLFLKKKQK